MGTGKATRKDPNHSAYGDIGGGQGQIDAQRALLGLMTMGTSEIKTGAGEYGDETVADSLFPKTINDMMLNDRQAAREDADLKAKTDASADNPGPPPDPSSALLSQAAQAAKRRNQAKQGRKSTFLTGAMGDVTAPIVNKKNSLGGY